VWSRKSLRQRQLARAGGRGRRLTGGQRFLGWITSRSTTPCLMRRTGRSARSGARSGSQSWNRGVNRDPPGRKPALFGGSLEGGRSGLQTWAKGASSGHVWRGMAGVARVCKLARRVRSWTYSSANSRGLRSGAALGRASRTRSHGRFRGCRVEGDGRGNPSVRSTRSRTSSGCSKFRESVAGFGRRIAS
jgi:hypothetical protein